MAIAPPVQHSQGYLDDDKGPIIIGLSIAVTGLSTIAVLARLFTRQKFMGRLHLDDWLSLAAMLFEWAAVAGAIAAVGKGNGTHFDLLDVHKQQSVIFWTILGFPFGLMALGLPKLAVSALLMRLMVPERLHRILLWVLPGFSMLTLLVCIALLYTRCLPTESLWNFAITDKKCYSPDIMVSFGIFSGAVCAFTDLYLAIYPASVLWGLQMNLKKKIALSVALGIGAISAVFAIYKCTRLPSLKSMDFSYDTSDLIIWTVLEASSLIIACCIPVLQPLIDAILGRRTFGSSPAVHSYESNNTGRRQEDVELSNKGRSKQTTTTFTSKYVSRGHAPLGSQESILGSDSRMEDGGGARRALRDALGKRGHA
ncbi:hypothetical protein ACJ41O_006758 [Fusarium nematophilum]